MPSNSNNPHHGIPLLWMHWTMNAIAYIFLKHLLNLPRSFVIVDKNSVDVPWVQSNALTLKCYDGDIQIRPFSFIVGHINGISDKAGMTRMEFFTPSGIPTTNCK